MSTRATIKFKTDQYEYFIYRHHDGFPDNILPDIHRVIESKEKSWSDPECECLVTCFLMFNNDVKHRVPTYTITSSFHGDESYRYYVNWDNDTHKWVFGML